MKVKLFTLVTAFLIITQFVNATTYYVRSSGGLDTNSGLSSTSAFQTLTKVFSLTLADGDTIDISGTFDYYVSKVITKSITIQGTDKSTAIIQGLAGSATRCFGIGDGTLTPSVTIENITFQNFDNYTAAGSQVGGAINVFAGASLICKNVNFINNRSYIGGAVNIVSGVANFEDCYFYNNRTTRAGGNNADGGAINVSIASGNISLTINRCLFEGNTTQNIASVLRFTSSTTGSTTLLVQNSTFVNNAVVSPSASTTAGCLYLDVSSANASTKLINNTIAYNTSVVASARAGISIAGVDDKIVLINNILYSNINGSSANVSISASKKMKECRNNITNQAYSFDANTMTSMAFNNTSSVSALNLDLAVSLADNGGATKSLTIGANSVAKNMGYATGVPTVDQRNFTRIGTTDVGAYEYVTFYRSKVSGNWGDIASWQSSLNNSTWADASVAPTSTDGSVNIQNGHEVAVAANAASSAITINSGGKLTLNDTKTLTVTGNFAIQSDATNGTGTFVDKNTSNGLTVNGTTAVQQYVTSSQVGVNGRNWYISSPLSAAMSDTISTATGNGLVYYNVGAANWDNAATTMDVMKGYIAKSPVQNTTITFTGGNLNTGLQSVNDLPLGFNLVGNPYASYVNWTDATKINIANSIWYRSKKSGSYNFHTYNVTGGIGVNDGTDIIPPMQSFWIKTTNATNSLGFTNAMRSHQDQSVVANRLMAPKVNTQRLLRLQVSNGINRDEAVVYFNENAQNSLDDFDTQKMVNNILEVPEIFTMIDADKLVINGMTEVKYNTEIPLGFSTLQTNNFSIKASDFKNFDTTTKIILKDNQTNTEQDLTDGLAYPFTSEPTTTTSRFSLIFKSNSVTTEVDNNENTNVFSVCKTVNGQISVISSNEITGQTTATVYNVSGQKLESKSIVSTKTLFSKTYISGIYLVSVIANGNTTTQKVVLN